MGLLWPWQVCIFYRWWALCHSTTGSIITSIFVTWCDITCVHVDYFSDESSSSTASGNAGGGESDSDSSYCPTSDSETVGKKGPVLGSIVIHPLVLQLMEPVTGTGQSSCKEPPEALEPVCSAVWSNSVVIPNRVVFVNLSQIGVFVDSINNIRGCKTPGCDGNLVPVAVEWAVASQFVLGVTENWHCLNLLPDTRMNLPTIMISV